MRSRFLFISWTTHTGATDADPRACESGRARQHASHASIGGDFVTGTRLPLPFRPPSRPRPGMRLAAAVATVAIAVTLAPPGAGARPDSGSARAVDARIGASDCALLGRRYVPGRGCSRNQCVRGAHLVKPVRGAELCALA